MFEGRKASLALGALGGLVAIAGASAQSAFRPLPTWAASPLDAGGIGPIPAGYELAEAGLALPEAAEPARARAGAQDFAALTLFGRADFGGDFQDGAGSLDTLRGGWGAVLGRATAEHLFAVELGVEGSFYRFDGSVPLSPSSDEPFNDLYHTYLAATFETHPASLGLGYFAGFETALGGEDEADLGDALTLGGIGGVRYRSNEALSLALGLAGVSRLEDDPLIWPFLGFDWRISDAWSLAILGPEIELGWALAEHWTLFAGAEYDLRQYRLNEDGPLAGAALRDEEIRLGGGFEWRPGGGFELRCEGGLTSWRELTTLADGATLGEFEVDGGAYAAVQLGVGF